MTKKNSNKKNKIPDYAENITTNQVIEKDPKVKNIGENDAYIYLKVTVPAGTTAASAYDIYVSQNE